jgi:hypothetical protein
VRSLNRIYAGERVAGIAADASDAGSLKRVFQGVDLVVVASTTARYARQVNSKPTWSSWTGWCRTWHAWESN